MNWLSIPATPMARLSWRYGRRFANGWLKNVKYNGDTIAEYSYDEVGNKTRQINGNDTYTDYTYSQTDARYMMSAITHYKMAGGVPVPATDPKLANSIVYARDAVGNPLSITDSVGKWQYGYDANNRLTAAVPPNPVPEQPAGGPYEYDWVGNRLNPPADPNPMVYNAADQLMSWPGMHTYTYYPDGSLYQEKDSAGTVVLKTYTYTPDGLLSTAEFNGKTLTNTWDADKNRVGFSGNSVDHTFVYDTTAGIPAVIVENGIHYIREPNGSLIARVSSSNTSYYHFDQLGSTRLLTDADGDVTDEYAYDAYGALLSHNRRAGSVGQPYQYVGRLGYYTCWQEPEFELLQLGIRYYDPSTGRFTQEDLSGDGLNWYEYVYGRPIIGTDPYGLFCTKDFVDHYYHGHGESIDLGNVGLLPRFRNSNSVRRSVENFHQMALSTAKKMAASKCRCHGGGSGAYTFSLDNNDVTDVTTEECLFAVGHSSFFRKGSCHLIVSCETRTFRLDCSMNYGIRDSFNDPLDIGIELPGGTAYKINAGWNERFETEGLW